MTFSFIDFGTRDFVRDHDDVTLKLEFSGYEAADDFIMNGGLEEYGWTNEGTKKWCWEEEA